MFKKGDTAYFVFQGDFDTGQYEGFYCLPGSLIYFPFIPIKITDSRKRTVTVGAASNLLYCSIQIGNYNGWNMPIDLLEKEFSIEKFIMATLKWDGTVSQDQFKTIMATL